jgi:hypothetical protein
VRERWENMPVSKALEDPLYGMYQKLKRKGANLDLLEFLRKLLLDLDNKARVFKYSPIAMKRDTRTPNLSKNQTRISLLLILLTASFQYYLRIMHGSMKKLLLVSSQ